MDNQRDFDAIVIGSGIGALTCASLMARLRNWRVLVLERHFKIGGFTHSFDRPGGWSWDVGVHYVGEMAEGLLTRRLFDFITDGGVTWNPMPDGYDQLVYPDFRFCVHGKTGFQDSLTLAFPEEKPAIDRYFRDLQSAMAWFRRRVLSASLPAFMGSALKVINRATRKLPLTITKQYLEERFRDPRLRAVLASTWGNYGLPPGQSAFVTHAIVATHYYHGAYYPVGGASEIARTTSAIVRRAGGELLVNHEVTRILVEGDRAVGVEAQVSQGARKTVVEFRAPFVVSDAGAWNTYTRLLPSSYPLPFREELKSPPEGFEVVQLYIGFRRDPRELGFRGENHWIFTSHDHDEMYRQRDELLNGRDPWAFLSFGSLKDLRGRRHTAEIITALSCATLEAYREEPWRHRSAGYEAAKSRITGALLALVERHYPGFGDLVEYVELATPLTFEHFTGAPSGAIYGYPGTPGRYRSDWLNVKTPVRNLYLTGADACSSGIAGALMGGVTAASRLLGPFGFMKVMRAVYSKPPDIGKKRRKSPADWKLKEKHG
jgi:all-trans-retinol 13,14-reductase